MAKVSFKRIENSLDIGNVPIVDGQITYTKDGKTYLDYEGQRVVVNGTPDTTMSDTSTNAIANSTVKNYVDTKINDVNSNMPDGGKILWANPNPTYSFASQTITLNSDDYDLLEIYYNQGTNNTKCYSVKVLKGYGFDMLVMTNFNEGVSQTAGARLRIATYVSDTSYSIGSGMERNNLGQSVAPTINNNGAIPLYIIGYKTELFN